MKKITISSGLAFVCAAAFTAVLVSMSFAQNPNSSDVIDLKDRIKGLENRIGQYKNCVSQERSGEIILYQDPLTSDCMAITTASFTDYLKEKGLTTSEIRERLGIWDEKSSEVKKRLEEGIVLMGSELHVLRDKLTQIEKRGTSSRAKNMPAQKSGWGAVGGILDSWKKDAESSRTRRINDLPGNHDDVRKQNVWSAPAEEIWRERKEVKHKLSQLDRIKSNTDTRGGFNDDKLAAIKENRARLTKRLQLLNKERQKRIKTGKWDGYVPPGDEDAPPPEAPPPDAKWGGSLPEVKKTNPTTMGRSEIEPEMEQLNRDRENLRKRMDHMNRLGDFAGKIGQKAQVEASLSKVIARLKVLEAEKKNQIKNGTWGYSSNDIPRTKANLKQIEAAYEAGKKLGKMLKTGELSSDEVRQATRDAYSDYQNNEKLKEAFKEGYGIGSQ